MNILTNPKKLRGFERHIKVDNVSRRSILKGLGLAGGELCGHTIWGHVGGVPGYETYSFTDSGGGRQVTVMVNRGLTVDGRVDEAITSMLATEFCGSR